MLLGQGAVQKHKHGTLDKAHLVPSAGCGLSSCSRLCMVSSRTTCRLLLIMKSAILHSSQDHVTCHVCEAVHCIVTFACSREATELGDRLGASFRSRSGMAEHYA